MGGSSGSFAFDPKSFQRWLDRTYDEKGNPRIPDPDVNLIGQKVVYEPRTHSPDRTYVYNCSECGFEFALKFKLQDDRKPRCWKCYKDATNKESTDRSSA